MVRVLVTGANGFVGGALVRELLKQGVEVIALDREGCNNNLPADPHVKFIPFDLANVKAITETIPANEYDVFYHLAWSGSAGPARTDITLQLDNAQWAVDSLRVAKELNCKKFICAGSIMEQETISASYTQGNRPNMACIYGGGKLIARVMCMAVAAQIGIDLVWPVITNAYGAGELSPRMLNTTIRKIIRGEPLQFTAGTQNYDFVYIDDVAHALYCIGENGKPFHEYLIASGNAKPLKRFLMEMKAAVAPDQEFRFGDVPFTAINLPLSAFDAKQTYIDTGFQAQVPFSEGVRRTMEWLNAVEGDDEI